MVYKPEFSASHTPTLLGMISTGLGNAVLSTTIANLNENKKIKFIPIIDPIAYRWIGMLKKNKTHQKIIDEFCLKLTKNADEWYSTKDFSHRTNR